MSTSMVMEFIFHKVPDPFLDLCDSCERVLYDEYFVCRHNDDYRLCKECLNKDGASTRARTPRRKIVICHNFAFTWFSCLFAFLV